MNWGITSGWGNGGGMPSGRINPPEYYEAAPYEGPTVETVFRFVSYRIVEGQLCVVKTAVEVDMKTHAVVRYGRKRSLPIASCFRPGVESYALRHPRSGPKLVAWMDEHWGASNGR